MRLFLPDFGGYYHLHRLLNTLFWWLFPTLLIILHHILVVISNLIDYFAPYFGVFSNCRGYFDGYFQLCRLLCTVIWWLFLSALTIFHHRLKVTFFLTECFHH